VVNIFSTLKSMARCQAHTIGPGARKPVGFLPCLSLFCGLSYLGIITLTGFHDRYLIPFCLFLIIWLISKEPLEVLPGLGSWRILPSLIPFMLMAAFSLMATRDFMETKRHVKLAQDFATEVLKVDPCHMDGGMEFNGYHCYHKDFKPIDGLSWWWAAEERYLITLGPLPGYEAIRTFPFKRHLGRDGVVYLLQPCP
jgi:hypothetical protein